MKKKVGIMTLYHNNNNYGGVAQAYALNKYFTMQGYDSEIITYKRNKNSKNTSKVKMNIIILFKLIKNKIWKKCKSIVERRLDKTVYDKLKLRAELLENFRNNIKHSKEYDFNTVKECENNYDFFVTGSDQCWKPNVIDENYVFNYIQKNNCVFSYAPSIAVNDVDEEYKEFMKKSLKKYKCISVREEKGKEILEDIVDREIEWVVDPTLLLTDKEWEQVTSQRVIEEKYVFSYLLGDSISQRRMIKKFAKKKGYKLVTIPHIKNGNKFSYNLEDKNFGDIQMLDIGFEDFLSLIKYSEYVITDSFHAVVFSYIFKKNFFALERNGVFATSSRIKSLLKILNLENRLIINKKDIADEKNVDYSKGSQNMENMINKSKGFIDNALN